MNIAVDISYHQLLDSRDRTAVSSLVNMSEIEVMISQRTAVAQIM